MTETIIITLCVLVVLAMFLVNRFSIQLPWLKASFTKVSESTIHDLLNLQRLHDAELVKYDNTIIKNQMLHAEGVLNSIEEHILACGHQDKYTARLAKDTAHMYLKTCFLTNGFSHLTQEDMLAYVQNKTDALRQIFRTNLYTPNEFIESAEFSDKISDIFSHGISCFNHWMYNKELSITRYNSEYNQLLKKVLYGRKA